MHMQGKSACNKEGLAQDNMFHTPPNQSLLFRKGAFQRTIAAGRKTKACLHTALPGPAGYKCIGDTVVNHRRSRAP